MTTTFWWSMESFNDTFVFLLLNCSKFDNPFTKHFIIKDQMKMWRCPKKIICTIWHHSKKQDSYFFISSLPLHFVLYLSKIVVFPLSWVVNLSLLKSIIYRYLKMYGPYWHIVGNEKCGSQRKIILFVKNKFRNLRTKQDSKDIFGLSISLGTIFLLYSQNIYYKRVSKSKRCVIQMPTWVVILASLYGYSLVWSLVLGHLRFLWSD